MKTIFPLFLLLACATWCLADRSPSRDWNGLLEYLGKNFDAKTAADFKTRFGAPTESKFKSEVIVDFDEPGVSLTLREGRIQEVTFQLAPGKRIADHAYSGPMPDSIRRSRESPEAARAVFGKPIEDDVKGHRKLTYLLDGALMTLWYAPGLDYVTFRINPAEQNAATHP